MWMSLRLLIFELKIWLKIQVGFPLNDSDCLLESSRLFLFCDVLMELLKKDKNIAYFYLEQRFPKKCFHMFY